MHYLTEQDYLDGLNVGIKRNTLFHRVYRMGWTVEKALTTPVAKYNDPEMDKWKAIAKKNGIKVETFYSRVGKGWTYEDAATTQPLSRGQVLHRCNSSKPRVFTDEEIAIAKANGLKYTTILSRNRRGWPNERAISEPVKVGFKRRPD